MGDQEVRHQSSCRWPCSCGASLYGESLRADTAEAREERLREAMALAMSHTFASSVAYKILREALTGDQGEKPGDPLCAHEWQYDEQESAGPWTGYIERCRKCGALQQIPQ